MRLMRAEPDAVDRVATEVEFQVTLDREFDGLRERSEHAQARFEQEIRDNVVHLLHDRSNHDSNGSLAVRPIGAHPKAHLSLRAEATTANGHLHRSRRLVGRELVVSRS